MSSLTVKISGQTVQITEGSFSIKSRVDDKDTAVFQVRDDTGTLAFNKGQPVLITDSVLGTLFSGYLNKPTMINLYPNATNMWSCDCVDQFYVPAKRTHKRRHKGQHAAPIVALQVQQYLAPDGVNGNFGLDWSELQSEWAAGTLTGAVAATNLTTGNVGAGNLELGLAGTPVSLSYATNADWNNGTLTNTSVANNQVSITSGNTIKYSATNNSNGGGNSYLYYNIWTGNYTIQANDALVYTMWIAGSSPLIKAGVDCICSDGTTFRDYNSKALVDQFGLAMHPDTDLKAFADGQWYTRTININALTGKTINACNIVFEGDTPGNYLAYFQPIKIVASGGAGATQATFYGGSGISTIARVSNSGYTNAVVAETAAYYSTQGTWQSTSGHSGISGVSVLLNATGTYTTTIPSGSSVLVETSTDGGSTWNALASSPSSPVSGFIIGQSVPATLLSRVTLSTSATDPTMGPMLNSLVYALNPTYVATKNDASSAVNATGFSSGTLTNTAVTGTLAGPPWNLANTLTLNGSWLNWNTSGITNQSVFGDASPAQANFEKQLKLTTGGVSNEVRSQFTGIGQWQNFTASIDVQIPVAAGDQVGLIYRTTNWVNGKDTYGWAATMGQAKVQVGYGSNTGSTGSFTNVLQVTPAGLNMAAGTWHTLTVVVNGTTHTIYVDGVQYISVTDSHINSTGYFGAHAFNGSGGTVSYYFNNFGVEAALTGTYQSPSLNLNSVGTVGNSVFQIKTEALPAGCTVQAQTSIDGGSTWQTATNGAAISGLSPGTNATGKTLLVLLTLTAGNAGTSPVVDGYSVYVSSQYIGTGTRTNAPLVWDSMTRLPVASGFGTASNGATYTQVGTGTTAVSANEATITNTTGDVHMQISGVAQQDTDATVRFSLSAVAPFVAGMELRYSNANSFYRLQVSTTTLSIIKVSGGISITLATVAMALTTSVFYRMHFRVVGSGIGGSVSLSGSVWLDGTTEPTTFSIMATD